MEKEKLRCFVSIDFPKEIKKEIVKVQGQLPEFAGKKTEYENLHLTLKFLGEIDMDKLDAAQKKLREVKLKSFECEIDSIGVFSEKYIKIIWLGLKNCEGLQKKIDENLINLFRQEARFMGHLTIARVKNVKTKKEFLDKLKLIKIPKIKFKVNEFCLNKSILKEKGPIYFVIEKYKLD